MKLDLEDRRIDDAQLLKKTAGKCEDAHQKGTDQSVPVDLLFLCQKDRQKKDPARSLKKDQGKRTQVFG